MNQPDEWVSAADALAILEPRFTAFSAARRICERAYAGLIRARAELFQVDGREHQHVDIPKEFWWAKGHEALEQDWAAGDFSTWIERRAQWNAFGVTFNRADIEKLLPDPGSAESRASVQSAEEKQANRRQELYLQLLHLEATAPDFTGATTPDMRLWLAQLRAAIIDTDDLTNKSTFEVALSMYSCPPAAPEYGSKILQCLYNALVHADRSAPSSMRGAFVSAGNAHDALAAVGKILGEAKRAVMLVDPYADAAILERYAVFAPEGVNIEVLADHKDAKPTLKPAADAWLEQYAHLRPLSVRLGPAKTLHDRLIILDEAVAYTVGQSFNALAARAPTSINRIVDAETARRKIEAHRQIWNAATTIA